MRESYFESLVPIISISDFTQRNPIINSMDYNIVIGNLAFICYRNSYRRIVVLFNLVQQRRYFFIGQGTHEANAVFDFAPSIITIRSVFLHRFITVEKCLIDVLWQRFQIKWAWKIHPDIICATFTLCTQFGNVIFCGRTITPNQDISTFFGEFDFQESIQTAHIHITATIFSESK